MNNIQEKKDLIVLLTEDSALARMMALKIIERQVKQVYVAQDGQEALEKVQIYEPDILITDIELPKKNGLQLASEAKAFKHDLQVVIVSSFNDPKYYQQAIDIGVAKYVLKPFSEELITEAINICEQRILKEQKALGESNFLRLLSKAVDQSSIMVGISDDKGSLIYANAKYYEFTGYTPEETLGNTFMFLDNGEIPTMSIQQFQDTLASGQEWRGEYKSRKKNGEEYWESISIAPVKNQAGELTNFVAVKEDITRKKQMEQQLQEAYLDLEQRVRERTEELVHANEQLHVEIRERKQMEKHALKAYQLTQQLISSITSILIAVSPTNHITHWNHQAENIFAIPASEAIGHALDDLPIGWNKDYVMHEIENLRQKGATARLPDIHYLRPDQTEGILGFSFNLVSKATPGNSSYILLGTDITNRKNIEAQTVFAQKMESIGQLAAGIAHEINTPVQYVGDNLHFIQECQSSLRELFTKYAKLLEVNKKEGLFPELIDEIETEIVEIDLDYLNEEGQKAIIQSLEGVERIAKIVRALKEFSHPSQGEKVFSDINKALNSTIIISRNEWKYVAELQTELEPELPMVNCLIDLINQALLNIIVNAADAIREKQQNGQHNDEKGLICAKTWSDDSNVYISISDTGTGIPDTVINKIFDPFFTTKEVGKGTGQGLTIAHDIIVNKHQGNIQVSSKPGQGTTFTIQLPIDG